MTTREDTVKRLVEAGWDEETATEAAAIEHGDPGCIREPSNGEGDDQPRPRRRVRRRTSTG